MNDDLAKLLSDEETVAPKKVKETVKKHKETVSGEESVLVKETVSGADKKEKKPKKKPRGKPAVIGKAGVDLEVGDNTKYLTLNMELFNLPEIDLKNEEQVNERIKEYFAIYAKYDVKPTVSGLAMALNGHSRQWLWSLVTGNPYGGRGDVASLPTQSSNSIKKAYELLAMLWENYMQNGKVNPVAGIFLGKNNYGYQDKTDLVVTPKKAEEEYNVEEIKALYSDSTPLIESSNDSDNN